MYRNKVFWFKVGCGVVALMFQTIAAFAAFLASPNLSDRMGAMFLWGFAASVTVLVTALAASTEWD